MSEDNEQVTQSGIGDFWSSNLGLTIMEVGITSCISLGPIVLLVLIEGITNAPNGELSTSLAQVLRDGILRGQLFLFCFSTLGAITWTISRVSVKAQHARPIYFFSVLAVAIVVSGFVGNDPTLQHNFNDRVAILSVACYAFCVIAHFYLAFRLNPAVRPYGESLSASTNKLAVKVASRKRGRN